MRWRFLQEKAASDDGDSQQQGRCRGARTKHRSGEERRNLRIGQARRLFRLTDASIGTIRFAFGALRCGLRRVAGGVQHAASRRANIVADLIGRLIVMGDGRRGRRRCWHGQHTNRASAAARGINRDSDANHEYCKRDQRPLLETPPGVLDRRDHTPLPQREVPPESRRGVRQDRVTRNNASGNA